MIDADFSKAHRNFASKRGNLSKFHFCAFLLHIGAWCSLRFGSRLELSVFPELRHKTVYCRFFVWALLLVISAAFVAWGRQMANSCSTSHEDLAGTGKRRAGVDKNADRRRTFCGRWDSKFPIQGCIDILYGPHDQVSRAPKGNKLTKSLIRKLPNT